MIPTPAKVLRLLVLGIGLVLAGIAGSLTATATTSPAYPSLVAVDRVFDTASRQEGLERQMALRKLLRQLHHPQDADQFEVCNHATERLHELWRATRDGSLPSLLDEDLDGGVFTCSLREQPDFSRPPGPALPRKLVLDKARDGGYCKLFVRQEGSAGCTLQVAEMLMTPKGKVFGDDFGRMTCDESREACGEVFTCRCGGLGPVAHDAGS